MPGHPIWLPLDNNPPIAFFFLAFMIVANFFILNLFIGIILDTCTDQRGIP